MIAKKIKTLRSARGWTQADLARQLGMSRNGVNSWEQGVSMPSLESLIELSKVFSVSIDYLLGREAMQTLNVTGLNDRDIAILGELADRLRGQTEK